MILASLVSTLKGFDLILAFRNGGKLIGADMAIYDPERDPDGRYGASIAAVLVQSFGSNPL